MLPKFEVDLDLAAAVVKGDQTLDGTVSATYTYGEPVEGTVSVSVYADESYYHYWGGFPEFAEKGVGSDVGGTSTRSNGAVGTLIATFEGAIDGSAQLELALTAAGAEAYDSIFDSGNPLIVEAQVTEAATGAVAQASANVDAKRNAYSVELSADRHFSPGVPVSVSVLATAAGGGGHVGERLTIRGAFSQDYDWRTCQRTQSVEVSGTVRTAADGSATLTFEAPDDSATCVYDTTAGEGVEEGGAWPYGSGSGTEPVARGCCYTRARFYLESSVSGVYASTSSSRALSVSGSGLLLAATSHNIAGGATVPSGETFSVSALYSTAAGTADVSYFVVSAKGGVVAAGAATAAGATATMISFVATDAMAPSSSLLAVYAGPDGELVADEMAFDVTAAAVDGAHSAAASFNTSVARPGERIAINVEAAPGARAFVLAVDRAVSLLGGSSALTAERVLEAQTGAAELPSRPSCARRWATSVLAQAGVSLAAPETTVVTECQLNSYSGGGYFGYLFDDAEVAEAMPVAAIERAAFADGAADVAFDEGAPQATTAGAEESAGKSTGAAQTSVKRVRKFFPESWVWMSADVGTDGALSLAQSAPDSITTWELSAFASAPDVGLGVAATAGVPSAELVVKKELFLSPRLPYSVVRGEALTVPVGVYNYGAEDIAVTLALRDSPGVEVVAGFPDGGALELPAGGSAAIELLVRFTELGAVGLSLQATTPAAVGLSDAVTRAVVVRAEGFERETVQNVLIDLRDEANADASTEYTFDASLPGDVIEGSARAYLSVVGDVMGPTLQGLESLLRMPSGCGEQNMIGLAPNVYVASYLSAVNKLDSDTETRAVSNMMVGYQRELNYRHPDGGFSAFGTQDQSASTWLTAFVLKVFAQAAAEPYEFIAVDTGVLSQASAFLANTQERDGHFDEVGDVIHTEMQGGAANPGDALTAFVLTALAEARRIPSLRNAAGAAAEAAVDVLADALNRLTGYPLTIACAALVKACANADTAVESCPSGIVDDAVNTLLAASVAGDSGTAYWPTGSAPTFDLFAADALPYAPHSSSSEVESTGYALQALLAAGRAADAAPAARWLLAQRNSQGGFSSTQDTVVALEALSEYAAALAATQGTVRITASDGGTAATATFEVNRENALVLQRASVSPGGSVSLSGSGDGIALVQLSLRYNTIAPPIAPTYTLRMRYVNDTSRPSGGALSVTACASVDGSSPNAAQAEHSGMVLLRAGVFSGYAADPASLASLASSAPSVVKRADPAAEGGAEIYLAGVGQEETCVSFRAERSAAVHDLAPATSDMFAYYVPELAGAGSVGADSVESAHGEVIIDNPVRVDGKVVVVEDDEEASDSPAAAAAVAPPLALLAGTTLALAVPQLLRP